MVVLFKSTILQLLCGSNGLVVVAVVFVVVVVVNLAP